MQLHSDVMLPQGKSDAAMGKVRVGSRGAVDVSLQMQRAFRER